MEPLELEIKKLILDKYGNLSRFANEIDMSWTTLDSILKRGILKANIVNVLKITNALNINTEKLGEGIIESNLSQFPATIAAHHDDEEWSDAELAEIEEFKKFVKSKRG